MVEFPLRKLVVTAIALVLVVVVILLFNIPGN